MTSHALWFPHRFSLVSLLLISLVNQVFGQSGLKIKPARDENGYQLNWNLDGHLEPHYQLQRSFDLKHWETLVDIDLRRTAPKAPPTHYTDREGEPVSFYRLIGRHTAIAMVTSAASGAELYGFSEELARRLDALGEITVTEFLERYPDPGHLLSEISYDPTDAQFWKEFNRPPGKRDPALPPFIPHEGRLTDFRLDDQELNAFKQNGFVVTGRLGHHSFADSYYRIFSDDLPVFITLDSVLNAWHHNYRSILAELEELILSDQFYAIIHSMREQLPELANITSEALTPSLHDADLYLTIILSLFSGPTIPSILGQSDAEIARILALIQQGGLHSLSLFGRTEPELTDFSQFKPRGYYTRSKVLRRYFQAAMWCGRIDLRVAGPKERASTRELGTAMLLREAMLRAGQLEAWNQFDRIIGMLAGVSDSMTVTQLGSVLKAAKLENVSQVNSLSQLSQLQEQIESGQLGVQAITSHGFFASPGGPPLKLPRSFTLFGQRFVMDSWALSHLVFDRIFRDKQKLRRRLPSAVDMAFTVLGNRSTADLLANRIGNQNGVPFRDGYPIQHQLGALADVFDAMPIDRWQDHIYNAWLFSLRQMSAPYEASFPEVFRTKAWSRKTLSSQLASWTQLRHNTVLLAKQSATPPVICSFPHSYVEPNHSAWLALAEMASQTADQFEAVETGGKVLLFPDSDFFQEVVSKRQILEKQKQTLRHFQQTCTQLAEIVQVQNRRQPLSKGQQHFLENMVEIMVDYVGIRTYSGWYPRLYYREMQGQGGTHPCDLWDPLVTDVHTDFPSAPDGDPGTILHEAVGSPAMMLISIDCAERRVYAGPVFTYYEFTSGPGNFDRMTDEDWKETLTAGEQPQEPEWTREHRSPADRIVPPETR